MIKAHPSLSHWSAIEVRKKTPAKLSKNNTTPTSVSDAFDLFHAKTPLPIGILKSDPVSLEKSSYAKICYHILFDFLKDKFTKH